jgi:hypothetical protein
MSHKMLIFKAGINFLSPVNSCHQRLNMEVDFQSLFGLLSRDFYSCTHWLRPRNPPPPTHIPPPPFGLVLRGRYSGQQR